MVYQSRQEILRIMENAYAEVYLEEGEKPPRISEDMHISDLGVLREDSAFSLEWRDRVAHQLGLNSTRLPKPVEKKDYTIRELVDILKNA